MTEMTFSPDYPFLWMRMSPVSSISSSDLTFKKPSKTNATNFKLVFTHEASHFEKFPGLIFEPL